MNRYKFFENDLPKVIKFLKSGKSDNIPNWATKFKESLSVKQGTLFFDSKEIVPKEQIEKYLRKKLYSKDAKLPFGRDSAHYHLLKNTVGISRRACMEFLRSQKNLQESKPSLAKPKIRQGIPLKKLQIQTDLIFVRKDDLEAHNPKFGNDETLKKETYIITSVEAASGLCRLDYLTSKTQTNAALEKHIHWFAKKFGVSPSSLQVRSDKGSEYSMPRIKKLCPDYKFVSSATICERKNRQVQSNFYRILKNRQATSIVDALKKTESMCNDTVAKKHKRTPMEIVEDPETTNKHIIDRHNKTRATFKKGDNRGDFEIGDHVRVLAPEKIRRGIGYKTYKGVAFEKSVHKIIKTTKRAKVKKYRLDDKRWLTQDRLMKTNPVDQESQKLIRDRDDVEKKELDEHRKELRRIVKEKEDEAERKKLEVKVDITKPKPKGRRISKKLLAKLNKRKIGKRKSALKNLQKLQKIREEDEAAEKLIEGD